MQNSGTPLTPEKNQKDLKRFLLAFLMPTLVGKSLVVFFGLNYSQYPDEGYGYGLTGAMLFTVFMLCRFVWKYRHVEDI
jgi:hypothetical protein